MRLDRTRDAFFIFGASAFVIGTIAYAYTAGAVAHHEPLREQVVTAK